jgi:DNA polymerase III subunit epsilon
MSSPTNIVPSPPDALRGRWVCVDLETSGGSPDYHRIIEVGIVEIEDGVVMNEWSTLVNPQMPVPAGISDVTGITDEMVVNAPAFAEIADVVRERCEGRVFVAHNVRFDYGFLRAEFQRLRQKFSAPVLCTVKLSRRMFPEVYRHNLDAIIERHALPQRPRHRALGDAQTLADFLLLVGNSADGARMRETIDDMMLPPALPPNVPSDLVDELPEMPGVYRFYDGDGALLFMHRADNLRARVLEHFTATKRSVRDVRIAESVARVDWITSQGALGASLLEIAELKRIQPLLNPHLGANRTHWTIRLHDVAGGCFARVEEIDGVGMSQCFGTFRSVGSAERFLRQISQTRQLCLRALGVESADGAGSCIGLQFGHCRGVCVGKEPIALHAARTKIALMSRQLRAWPYEGRVALRDSRLLAEGEVYVFENWRHLGTARDTRELDELMHATVDVVFDYDIFRLLVGALKDRRLVPCAARVLHS